MLPARACESSPYEPCTCVRSKLEVGVELFCLLLRHCFGQFLPWGFLVEIDPCETELDTQVSFDVSSTA